MVQNLEIHRSNLLLTETYAASPGFITGIGWQVENSGHVVVKKESNEDCVITVVGKIVDYRFLVGPHGNYSSEEFGDFSTAKFLFHLGKPNQTPFEEDFEKAMQNFDKIQAKVAGSLNRVNFIASDVQNRTLRFTRNVFEKRDDDIPQDGSEMVDERTEKWPVKANLRDALDRIKFQYEAKPLPVYVDERFIKPTDVYEALKGAIVEVQFELRHYRIQKKKVDSFNATVQQVFILKPGIPRLQSAFKRWNAEDGPVKVNHKAARIKEGTVPSRFVEETAILNHGVPTLELEIIQPKGAGSNVSQRAESSAQGAMKAKGVVLGRRDGASNETDKIVNQNDVEIVHEESMDGAGSEDEGDPVGEEEKVVHGKGKGKEANL